MLLCGQWVIRLFFYKRLALCLIHNAVTHQFHIVEIAADVLHQFDIVIRAFFLIGYVVIWLNGHAIFMLKYRIK